MAMWRLRGVVVALCLVLCAVVRVEACGGRGRITFGGFERVTHLSTSGMNLWVSATNDSCWRMVVKEAEVDIFVEGQRRMTISLRDKVVLPRRSTSNILVPLRITSHSMFSIVGIVGRIAIGNSEDVTVNYSVRAGSPLFKRTIAAEGVPVDVLLEQLSMSDGEIGVLKQLLE